MKGGVSPATLLTAARDEMRASSTPARPRPLGTRKAVAGSSHPWRTPGAPGRGGLTSGCDLACPSARDEPDDRFDALHEGAPSWLAELLITWVGGFIVHYPPIGRIDFCPLVYHRRGPTVTNGNSVSKARVGHLPSRRLSRECHNPSREEASSTARARGRRAWPRWLRLGA
jgi:hypothetical protein